MSSSSDLAAGEALSVVDLKLPDDDIERLKKFYGLDDIDEKRLVALHRLFTSVESKVVENLVSHLLQEPETSKYLRDPQVVERTKTARKRLLRQLVAGSYDVKYVEDHLQAGRSQNIPPKWSVGMGAHYLDLLSEELQQSGDTEIMKLDTLTSLAKMIFFETGLEMESFTIDRSRQLNQILMQVGEAEEFTRSILNAASNVGVYAFSTAGLVQSWNKGAENLLGYEAEEVREMDFHKFFAEDADVDAELKKAMSTGTVVEHQAWLLRKNGIPFFARISTAPLRDDTQRIKGFVQIVQDETLSMQARNRLEQQRKEIAGVAAVLSDVTSQVAHVATTLSSATAESVAAITETTATSDEVRQTAEQTSLNAKSVSEDAKNVLQVSRQGQEATDHTIRGMVHIREQMESIADCMAQLTSQSRLIGDIIAFVDDLAQQSNLLAVNASIEAAKAGEQGKGFAVVAQEVKNLSQQSKKATAHVRSILNDVVRATSAATAATELGARAVENGHQQASGAGAVIKTLTDSIDKAAQATELIEISSQQQLVGMKQVVNAMESIRELSGDNLQSAKQLDAAGKQLSELGKRLLELTSELEK